MRRIAIAPRGNLADRAKELGFGFYENYWDESAYYAFSLDEIERDLEAPTQDLAGLCLELAGHIIKDDALLRRLSIPQQAWKLIRESWKEKEPSLYGRFDFAYGGDGPCKLLEYNADTPTSLYEAAVFQWAWLEDLLAAGKLPSDTDQFNSLHEKLIARLRMVGGRQDVMHFAAMLESEEDRGFLDYMQDCARQAGFTPVRLAMKDIGLNSRNEFVDLYTRKIDCLFKLYPWEWMLADSFGSSPAMWSTRFLEPPWKAVLSNKGILPLLWEMAPGHPNLLPAFFEDDPRKAELGAHFVRKPIYSREGANVTIVDGNDVVAREEGSYGAEGYIRQAIAPMKAFDGNYPVIGSWLIGADACGIGIREDKGLITCDTSRFVPHVIDA